MPEKDGSGRDDFDIVDAHLAEFSGKDPTEAREALKRIKLALLEADSEIAELRAHVDA